MAIGTLFGSNPESSGLYGIATGTGNNPTVISQTYFEWFIFTTSSVTPATPTGGSWDFNTNTGTAPAGWSSFISGVPLNSLWFSVAFVDSRNPTVITWTAPGLLSSQSIYATAYADVFTGNGSTVAWTLTQDPVVVNNTDVSINGVTQVPGTDYTLSGTTLTTTTAAPLNAIILVKYRQALPLSYYGAASNVQFTPVGALTATNVQSAIAEVVTDLALSSGSSTVGYLPAGTGAVATTVQSKLRENVSVFDFMTAAQIADVQAGTALLDVTAAINAAIATGNRIHFPAGTYLANVVISTATFDIYGDGMNRTIIKPFSTSLPAIKNMADPGSANFWRRSRISDLSLQSTGPTGNGFTFGDPAAFTTNNERIGRVDFQDVEITGFNKAVFKTCGNIGNNFFNCRIQNNNYNYYAQSSDFADAGAPAMHCGFDSFYGGAWGYAGLASVFVRDRILGKGGWTFRDVDIEGNTGYAVVALANTTFDYVPDLTFDACWFEANATGGSITVDGLTGTITGLPRDLYISGIKHVVAKEIYLGKLTLLNGCNFIADKCGTDTFTAGIFNLSVDGSSTFVVDGWTYTTGMAETLTLAPYASTTDNASTTYTAVTNTMPGPICAPVKDYTVLLGYSGTAPIVAGGGGYNGSVVSDGLTFNTCSEYVVTGSAKGIVPAVTTVVDKYYAVTFQARLASGSPGYFYVNNMTNGELIDHSEWRQYSFVKKATTTTSGFSANSAGVSSTLRIGAMQIVQFDGAKEAYEYLYRGRIATNSDARSAAYPLAAFTDVGGGGASFNSGNIAATVTNSGYTKLCEASFRGDLTKIKVDLLVAFNDLYTGGSLDQLSGFTTLSFASTASTPTQVFGAGTVTFRWVQQGSTRVWDLQGSVTTGPATAIVLAGLAFIKGK